MKSKRFKNFDVTYAINEKMKNEMFYTKCKKDNLPHYKNGELYLCLNIDETAKCVLYDGFDNLVFTNSEFIEFFYTESGMRKLKLEKLKIYEKR
jgi:hypothetical protein